MRNIKLTVEYDGTLFEGWQVQPNGHRTVQGELEKALNRILKKQTRLIGSGRTDSGVHALAQVANFKTASDKSVDEIKNALNANCPDDLAILNVEEAKPHFHAQYSVKTKTYRYTILNRDSRCAQNRHYVLYYPYKLNLLTMKAEAKTLLGKHDFKSFVGSNPKSNGEKKQGTVRNIKRLDIKQKGDYIIIEVEANGFLYKMVRNIVGTLLEVGSGRLPKESVKEILSGRNRTLAGATAQPQGLSLVEVKY